MTNTTLPSLPVTQSKPATDAPTNCAVSTGSAESVFELVELLQCDDNYFPLGIYPTLADAIAEVDKHGAYLCDNAQDGQDWAGVEIRKRKFGRTDIGVKVWSRSWKYDFEREHGDRWQVLQNAQDQTRSGLAAK